jgi:hypothetical protein
VLLSSALYSNTDLTSFSTNFLLRESNGIIKGNNNRINAIKSTKVYLISICSSINVMPDYTTTATILPFDTT